MDAEQKNMVTVQEKYLITKYSEFRILTATVQTYVYLFRSKL